MITYDRHGYILWKGQHIEHYDWSLINDEARFAEMSNELARRCRHLEELRVRVSTSTVVWRQDWFEMCTPDEPLLPLLRVAHEFIERGNDDWAIFFNEGDEAETVYYVLVCEDGMWHIEVDDSITREEHAWWNYRQYTKRGWRLARMGQKDGLGTCYATLNGIKAWLTQHGIDTRKLMLYLGTEETA
jgi:hypothetical protein